MIKRLKSCRVCNAPLEEPPLLTYRHMPRSAQEFPDLSELDKDNGIDLVLLQCSSCGLVLLDAEPVPYYRDVIRAAAFSPEMANFRKEQFDRFLSNYGLKRKKILEVGCGRGEYLQILKDAGANAYGLENNADAVEECLSKGLNVQRGFIDRPSYKLQQAPFDAFMILNFLEHLPSPVETLRGIASNLAKDALGLVEVPNLDMIIQKGLFAEFISDHLLYFVKETFVQTLAISGFQVLECGAVWHDYILSAVVRKRQTLELSGLKTARVSLQSALNKFIDQFPDRTVAIWGAGHQALAIMALTEISPKIKYVVDSATFKQGKFTPATHVAIVSPEILKTEPPLAVIVMAASYTDEVVHLLLRMGTKIKAIAALDGNVLKTVKQI